MKFSFSSLINWIDEMQQIMELIKTSGVSRKKQSKSVIKLRLAARESSSRMYSQNERLTLNKLFIKM
jgi:hypothetical protein